MEMVGLASPLELWYKSNQSGVMEDYIITFPEGALMFAPTDLKNRLYFVAPGFENVSNHNPSHFSQKAFEVFTGRESTTVSEILLPNRFDIVLGKAIKVLYKSNKLNGGGDGTENFFKHIFSKNTMVLTNDRKKNFFVVVGQDLYIDDRGIVN